MDVDFESENRLQCTFLQFNTSSPGSYTCTIKYGHCELEPITVEGYTMANSPSTVRIDLQVGLQNSDCYIITGSNGTLTVLIKGVLYTVATSMHGSKVRLVL